MELTGDLKKQVDNEVDIEAKRSIIEKAGMKLTDEELSNVAGGGRGPGEAPFQEEYDPPFDPPLGPSPFHNQAGSPTEPYEPHF